MRTIHQNIIYINETFDCIRELVTIFLSLVSDMESRSKSRVDSIARSAAKNNEDAAERQYNAEKSIKAEIKEVQN